MIELRYEKTEGLSRIFKGNRDFIELPDDISIQGLEVIEE